MNYLNLVSPALDIVKNIVGNSVGLIGKLAKSADSNPKTSLAATVAGLGWLNPEYVVGFGNHISNFGLFVAKVGQMLGG